MLSSRAKRTTHRPVSQVKRLTPRAQSVETRRAVPVAPVASAHTARRPLMLLLVIALCGAGLFSRLVFWQVMQHAHLTRLATQQQMAIFQVPPLRGRIYDGSGNPLAAEGTADVVSASANEIKNPVRTARLLAPILHVRELDLQRNLESGATYVLLSNGVPDGVGKQIARLQLPGIVLTPQPIRMYPEHQTAAQVVGYLDANGQGQYGIESQYDSVLAGTASLQSLVRSLPKATSQIVPNAVTSLNGGDVTLSLSATIQNEAESELNAAVKKHRADGGTIIVEDPRTGYLLAVANNPTFDPNKYAQYANAGEVSRFMNPAVSDTYEPGSTFKIVTMAAGLDTGVITPNTSFLDTGVWMVDGIPLHNWNNLGNGEETMTQVLQHSANVGASFVANRLGAGPFYTYVRRFGIGRPTGVGLPGEVAGTLWQPGDRGWSPVTLYTNSFGQGVTTTPLQMVRAVAAVANGGIMMQPQIVRSIVYRGHLVQSHPVRVRRVVSTRTAHTLTHMLVESAIGGEAEYGLVRGYDIAAKTGTANVADGHGGYIQGDTIASIVGYAPAENPRYVVLVKLDHPRDTPWGSMAAAPVLHDMFQDLFMYGHIAPSPHALYR